MIHKVDFFILFNRTEITSKAIFNLKYLSFFLFLRIFYERNEDANYVVFPLPLPYIQVSSRSLVGMKDHLFCSEHEVISVGPFIVHESGQHLDTLGHLRQVARDGVDRSADGVMVGVVSLAGQSHLKQIKSKIKSHCYWLIIVSTTYFFWILFA